MAESAGYAKSSGGRKPRRVRFVPRGACTIGIAVHPERVEAVRADLDLNVLDACDVPFRRADQAALLAAVSDACTRLLPAFGGSRPVGAGVSLPGIVDEERALLTEAPNLLLDEIPLGAFSEAVSAVRAADEVCFENEANAAALAESWVGASDRRESLAFVSVSEGVGVGVLLDGRLYRGARYRAGEFGHVPIPGARRRCNCGSIGCWEQYASQTALLRLWNARRPDLDGLAAAVTAGEARATRVVRVYAAQFAMGLRNVIRCLDAPAVVIGGPVAALSESLVEAVRGALGTSPMESPPPRITLSRLGPHAAALGAAVLPLWRRFPVVSL
ncbi:MAG: ROK family protein [Spirochaetaceae bacterium]|nr:MAG: ROK family protein [Spirochaetaceae bacterium]